MKNGQVVRHSLIALPKSNLCSINPASTAVTRSIYWNKRLYLGLSKSQFYNNKLYPALKGILKSDFHRIQLHGYRTKKAKNQDEIPVVEIKETVVVKKRGRKKKIVQDADKVEPSTTKCITNNMEQETRQGYDPVSLEKNTKEFTSLDQPHTAIEEERIKDNTKEVSKIQEQGLRKTAVKKRGKKKSIDELENHDDDEETSVIASKSKSDSCSKTKTKAKTKTKTKAKTKTKTKTKPTAAGISKPSIASKLCDTEQEKLDTESEVNPHRGMVENENAPAWSGVRLKDDDLLEENTQEYTDANNACAVGEMDAVEPLVTGERGHSNSVVLRGVRENLKKYPHCVLLTRVGDFYELYYNQADEIGGALLGLQVVDKKYGKADSVRFTGFPARSLERYLELLVMKYGKSVALCNQFRVKDRPVFIRKVTRIFTPGTWMLSSSDIQSSNENNGYQNYVNSADRMDTELGEQQDVQSMSAELGESLESDFDQSIRENNYFSSGHQYIICVFKNSKSSAKDVGLAWIDITTGDFVTATTNVEDLSADMARIRPREIVVDQSAEEILVELKNIYPFSAINETYKPANIISPISGQFNREDKLQKNIHRNSMLTNTRATNCGPTITVLGSHMFDEGNYQLQDPQSPGSNLSSGTYQSLDDSELFGMQDEVSGELAGQETETRAQYEALLSSLLGNEQTGGDTDSAEYKNEYYASVGLLNYIASTQAGRLPLLQQPIKFLQTMNVRMNPSTIAALELVKPIESMYAGALVTSRASTTASNTSSENGNAGGGVVNSTLVGELDYTCTKSGSRLLTERLTSPSTSYQVIEQRLNLVDLFARNTQAIHEIRKSLLLVKDAERAVQRLSLDIGGPIDLLCIQHTLHAVEKIKDSLGYTLKRMLNQIWVLVNPSRLELDSNSPTENLGDGNAAGNADADLSFEFSELLSFLSSENIVIEDPKLLDIIGDSIKTIQRLDPLQHIRHQIFTHIRQDIPAKTGLQAYGFLKPNCTESLSLLSGRLAVLNEAKDELVMTLQNKYNAPSLKLVLSSPSPISSTSTLASHSPTSSRLVAGSSNGSPINSTFSASKSFLFSSNFHSNFSSGYLEVSKRDALKIEQLGDPELIQLQSLKGKSKYTHKKMALLLAQLDLLHEQIQLEEQNVFNMLKILVLESHNQIKSNCSTLSVLDVSCCLAKVAVERGYTRPTFNINGKSSDDMVLPDKNYDHSIISGRHPVVELRLSENGIQFVPNDCVFDSNCHITLLTGPNMGGKSTYLRQVALISVMAQMGSFVPAENAALKIVDSIYTRIGAHDNLALNQSTFMVEMLETADILKHATSNSLVIMDEVGRGTSTADGMAIAYATLAYLHENIKPLCLFATHYHEIVSKFFSHRLPFSFDHNSFYLNSSLSPSSSSSTPSSSSPTISSSTTTSSPLPISFDKLKLMHTAIQDQIDPTSNSLHFTFIHKVLPGICTNSHGLYVAALAGVPNSVIKNAESFITTYRSSII